MKRLVVMMAMLAASASAFAGESRPAAKSPVREGQYSCVFNFGGQFFDSKPIKVETGKYRSSSGEGTWTYLPSTRTLKFLTGSLAPNFTGSYVASGVVPGGLKNKKGPAIVLKPTATYKKRQGSEAVPLYCYLE